MILNQLAHVLGDTRNGIALALGCKLPHTYRVSLRRQPRPTLKQLEATLLVPAEFLDWILSGDDFEKRFTDAIVECDQETAA
jgi:hypothetical protein